MAGDWNDEADALLERAEHLPYGDTKTRILEEAVRLADLHGDIDRGYALRGELIDAATFGGAADKVLVAFAWCRGQQKKDPKRFDPEEMLWKQKWVVGLMDEFPSISRQQIAAALDDLEQGFARVNAGKRAMLKLRYLTAMDMGEVDEAERLWAAWIQTPRDHLTDCRVCELDDELDHHVRRGEWELALRKARPLLDGRQFCTEVPHQTFGTLLYPLFRLGRMEEARDCHQRGYALIAKNREFLATVGEHLEFLGLTDNLERGLALFERHLGWALEHASRRDRFTFYTAAGFLLGRVVSAGRATATLRLPRDFELYQSNSTYETRALAAWMDAQSRDLALQFDARNGTDRFARLRQRTEALRTEVRPFALEG
ncbi:hypothetical protein DRW03_31430 [Corallococcus sp. H22C18031201]|uniref:hypothetical protein n=1 Tax=Citreicoccus inhibens TaxID=2849499 RepID=UPI000E70A5FC|nr:hypothetical protein [Citreicoccus inhibens]MBU8894381.1 hypothetical protein [Citreicoccus inhibens]RJS16155.1 hypothetical protein DRW03_31430 [Corallococcus sp. H22C18031201]